METTRIIALLAAAAVLLSFSVSSAQESRFKNLGAEQLKKEVQSGKRLLVIDSRTEQEYNDGHLPGAINIDPSRFAFIAGFLPRDKSYPLVFYCRGYG